MDVIVDRCAGLDVHKASVTACVRSPGKGKRRRKEVRTYATFTDSLRELAGWLHEEGVTQVAMEATGVFWKPVWWVLEEAGFECLLVNATHVKKVPGRKTDVLDAEWLAQLLECGLLRGSFVPPKPIRELRDLTRYRTRLVQERVRETLRVHKVLEDAGIKLAAVATDALGVSGRAMTRIGAAHARAAQVRRDALAKLTTTLACRHEVIVVEHLRAKNLARRKPGAGKGGRALNRALGDAALAEVRRLLGYKTTWYGSTLVEADPFYPSSRSCSACGGRKPSLRLAERAWTCPSCGAAHDRDRNAATNLARLGEHQSRHAGSGPVAGRRADRKTPPNGAGGADPSTPQSDAGHQTGTATSQEEAA